jgi:branched-chain amino acid aminotransferase
MNKVYLNGRLVDERRAVVSALDRGLLYGDGLFETMRAYGGRVFRLDQHLARMARSAKALRIPFDVKPDAVTKLLRANGLADAYVRITLTRGVHGGDLGLDTGARPTQIIQARAFHAYPPRLYRRGMKVALADAVRPSRSAAGRHKTLSYIENLLARDAAKGRGFDETLFLDDRGFVAECATSNLFWAKKGTLFTPAASMNILPGITRAAVIEIARADGVKVKEGRFRLAELKRADEVFLTNSLMEVMPVREVAGKRIFRHVATRGFALAYRRLVAAEC